MTDNDFPVRISELGTIHIISASNASIVQFGDRAEIDAKVRALAVQREVSHEERHNVYFESYAVFNRPLPLWPLPEPAEQSVTVSTHNIQPRICVGSVDLIAASSSAMLLIGNGLKAKAETRIKHIRQFAASRAYPPVPGP
ncbi:spore germination protein PE [Paenibacillus phyllosphaerae]|uniref:Spore germination protein PE n=1 Tax=Paenibacillus phyllosphaerae TaxID=274593 RepID=A0A7W5FRJ0_9BACL|nr:spore germination protein GerPE [Paenibacillus phyllosphaerae]MBB3114403.1 spore germination protein PE [Paenibacillus phyllosphaerae]